MRALLPRTEPIHATTLSLAPFQAKAHISLMLFKEWIGNVVLIGPRLSPPLLAPYSPSFNLAPLPALRS